MLTEETAANKWSPMNCRSWGDHIWLVRSGQKHHLNKAWRGLHPGMRRGSGGLILKGAIIHNLLLVYLYLNSLGRVFRAVYHGT